MGPERRGRAVHGRLEVNPSGEEPTDRPRQKNAGLWEPYDGRLSRTVLREREGEVPSRHSPGRRVGLRRRGARVGSGSGRRSLGGCPARTRPVWPGCPRRSGRGGSVRLAGCHRSVWLRCRSGICLYDSVVTMVGWWYVGACRSPGSAGHDGRAGHRVRQCCAGR